MFLRMSALMLVITTGASGAPARFIPITFKAQSGETIEADKGEFTVPENRSRPDSRRISIRFVRFKSTAAKPGYPIVYLAGGPGGSGIGAATGSRFPLFMALRELGDVIAYDQRGTNESGGAELRCEETYAIAPGEPLDRAKAGASVAAAMRKCVERVKANGVDVAAYNTRENAADLEDLRNAIGAEKLVLWGISYGTHLGIATTRYYPQSVDRLILAGIEGPDDTYKLPSDQQTLMEDIARFAARDGKHPDLLAATARVLRELEVRPKSVTLTDPRTDRTATFVVGKLDLQLVLADMLFAPENFAPMPDLISRLEQGDWSALALDAMGSRTGTPPSVMSAAMDCASGITAARSQTIAQESSRTLLADAINMPFPEICAGVDFNDAGDGFRGPLVTEVPALLISGTLDGRTRPRQAEELRMTMPNAQHLVIENAGHSDPLFLSTPKILEAMKTFIRSGRLAERYVVAPAMHFLPLRRIVTVDDAILSRYVGVYRVDEKSVRRVVKAGSLLYTIRDEGQPFPIRPSSETEFFYEGQPSTIRFELDAQGNVVSMLFRGPDGVERRAVRENTTPETKRPPYGGS